MEILLQGVGFGIFLVGFAAGYYLIKKADNLKEEK